MANLDNLRSLMDKAVSDVLTKVMPDLRDQIVRRLMEETQESTALAAGKSDGTNLNDALAAVQAGATQVQILEAMIEGASKFAARTALYVVRGTHAVGWRAKGFADDDGVRTAPLDASSGLAGSALSSRTIVAGSSEDFVPGFGTKFGAPMEECLVCPLVVRDKVVALMYADGGVNN